MSPFTSARETLNIAHRGGAGERPESTLEAFRHALAAGADVLELDVHLSRDREVIVCHDADLKGVSGEEGRIAELTGTEIRRVDAGAIWSPDGVSTPYAGKGLTLPSLAELFEELPEAQMNVDIKVEDPAVVERVAELIRRFDRVDRTVVASFSARQLKRFRKLAPEIATSAHPWDVRRFYALSRLGLPAFARSKIPYLQVPEYHGSLHLVTKQFVEAAHRAGRQVHVWTVNEPRAMQRLLELHVDGIVTDFPSTLTSLLENNLKGRHS